MIADTADFFLTFLEIIYEKVRFFPQIKKKRRLVKKSTIQIKTKIRFPNKIIRSSEPNPPNIEFSHPIHSLGHFVQFISKL